MRHAARIVVAASQRPRFFMPAMRSKGMRSLLVGLVLLSPLDAQQLTRTSLLDASSLQADLQVLREAYGALHPGLYRYQTPAEVGAGFDAVAEYFRRDRTVGEAFLALTRLTASIRCGHSYPNFVNQPERIALALFHGTDKLPFEFRWLGRRMIVTADHSERGTLPRGSEVLTINGVPAGSILDSLLPLARADGGNDSKRVAYLEVQGRERYHAFDVLFPLILPVDTPSFLLTVRQPGDSRLRRVRVAALTLQERQQQGNGPMASEAPDAPLWSYRVEGALGVLLMPTWALFNSTWDAVGWTDSVLQDLERRKIPDLVIDLRGNEGGTEVGNALLARLIDAPLRVPLYRRHVRYRRVPDTLAPYLDTWDPSFRDWGESAQPTTDSLFYRLTRWDDDADGSDIIVPALPRYRGRVWVIVDATNSSATFQFALAVKQSGVATLVGQPTGGNRRGINGGAFFFLRLPRTGIEVDLPLIAGFPDTPQPDAGVVPDILVQPSVADIARGADPAMRAIRQRITAGRGPRRR